MGEVRAAPAAQIVAMATIAALAVFAGKGWEAVAIP
jgi:hypothetical protein